MLVLTRFFSGVPRYAGRAVPGSVFTSLPAATLRALHIPHAASFANPANFAKRKPRTKLLRNYSACCRLSQSETRNKFIAMRHLAQAASQGSPIFRTCNYSSLIMLMPLEVPSLVAPASINSFANRAVRMPPLAFTPKSSPTVFRIRAT